MSDLTHPQCERCWCERNSEIKGADEGGVLVEEFRNPFRVKDISEPELCCFCGYPTWAGIFVRAAVEDTPFHGKAEIYQERAQHEL